MNRYFSLTFDIEDHRPAGDNGRAAEALTRRILDLCDELGTRSTFFVVGDFGLSRVALMRTIVERGHELALHSYRHVPLDRESAGYAEKLRACKQSLEDAVAVGINGYRAPIFSLCERTQWVTEVLLDCGFGYSSSVLPGTNPLYGLPDAPRQPFTWPNGLLELPVPVGGVGRIRIPYLGGVYLRYLPKPMVGMLAQRDSSPLTWSYLHPYDFATGESYCRLPDTSHLVSLPLWFNRRGTESRLRWIVDRTSREVVTLAEFAGHLMDGSRAKASGAVPCFPAAAHLPA